MSSFSLFFNDQISTDSGDSPQRSYEISSDQNNEYDAQMTNNNNGSVDNQRVPLPRKRKAYFFLSYSIFLILYLAFLLIIAYTYPLKPVCNIKESDIYDLYHESLNGSEKVKDSFYLVFKFNNRNPLISISYEDSLNISVYYMTDMNVSIYFAETRAPGFYQHKLNNTEVTVHMAAPELSQISQMQETISSVGFQVKVDFKVSFHCRVPCKQKQYALTLNE